MGIVGHRIGVEPLEQRRHFAAVQPPSIGVNPAGTLFIQGTGGDDSIRIRRSGRGQAEIFVIAADVGADKAGVILMYRRVALADVKRIEIDGGTGHDVLRVVGISLAPSAVSVEHTILTPRPAAQGQTPSDPATGLRAGSEAAWADDLQKQLQSAQASNASTAFFGDSNVENYPVTGSHAWDQAFPHALSLGIGGDGTGQLLDRIAAGQFDTFKPQTLVLMFGTNNLNDPSTGTDAQIEAGIRDVVSALRAKLPDTKLVLISILPRRRAGFNDRIAAINAATATLADGQGVFFLDVFDHFVGDPVRTDLYRPHDEHLNAKGYLLLTDLLAAMLKTI